MRKVKIPDDAPGKSPRSQLIGVVSFGPQPCGQRDVPGVYARVNSYLDWILQTVADNAKL